MPRRSWTPSRACRRRSHGLAGQGRSGSPRRRLARGRRRGRRLRNRHHRPDGGRVQRSLSRHCLQYGRTLAEDVSEDVAREISRRFDLQLSDVPSGLQDFVERHEGYTGSWRCGWSERLPRQINSPMNFIETTAETKR